jgi:hypothetical protein
MRLTVEVPIEEGELIGRVLDCAVAAGEVTTEIDPKTAGESKRAAWREQQADALVAVAKSYLGGGHDDEGGVTADHYQVVVHADAKAVRGGGGCSDLPIDTVKRLLCDGSLVLVAENGNPLDVGRKQRTVSTALRRALYARDRRCMFPGCQRKRYCAGHHLKHWIDGGKTAPANMTLLCEYHHTSCCTKALSASSRKTTECCDSSRPTAARSRATAIGSKTSSTTASSATTSEKQTRHVADSAPARCGATSNQPKCARRAAFIA